MSGTSDDYQIGYGRPPRHSRWKKGQSGNRRNRRRKSTESAIEIIDRLLLAPIYITMNGARTKVPTVKAIILQLVQKSIAGDAQAKRLLLRYRKFASENTERKLELTFVDSDYTSALSKQEGEENV